MSEALDIDEAEAILAAATPGPWTTFGSGGGSVFVAQPEPPEDDDQDEYAFSVEPIGLDVYGDRWRADAAAIVWLRNHADALLAAYRDRGRWKADAARLLVERHEQVHAERWAKCQAEAALVLAEREVERLRAGISGVADLIDTDVTSGHAFPRSYAVALRALAASRDDQP